MTNPHCDICGAEYNPQEEVKGVDYHGYLTIYSPYMQPKTLRICSDCLKKKLGVIFHEGQIETSAQVG